MVAVIIILSLMLLTMVFIGFVIIGLMNPAALAKPDPQNEERLLEWFNNNVAEEFPCTLLLDTSPFDNLHGTIADFTYYEDYGVIGLIESVPGTADGEINIIPDQVVCLMKDGSYQWDIRKFIGDG